MKAWVVGMSCAAAAIVVVQVVATAGCSEAPQVDFGNPNTLDRKNLPGEGGTETLSCTSVDAGTFDGGCPSFDRNIYPLVRANGAWRCADGTCHGTVAAPIFACATEAECLQQLRQINVGGKPYIAEAGTLSCNLQGSCGSKMPRPPGLDPSPSELCMIEAWLSCGAPR